MCKYFSYTIYQKKQNEMKLKLQNNIQKEKTHFIFHNNRYYSDNIFRFHFDTVTFLHMLYKIPQQIDITCCKFLLISEWTVYNLKTYRADSLLTPYGILINTYVADILVTFLIIMILLKTLLGWKIFFQFYCLNFNFCLHYNLSPCFHKKIMLEKRINS